jgi:hypothetical protein
MIGERLIGWSLVSGCPLQTDLLVAKAVGIGLADYMEGDDDIPF